MNKNIIWESAKCNDYYKFISKLQYLNIVILDIKYEKKIVYLKVYDSDFEKLEKYLVSYKFKKEKNTGLHLLIDKIKTNYIFVISIFIGIFLFLVLKNLVVEVNIIHENKEIREMLADELEEYGIKVLSFKKSYKKLDEIRQIILDKYPDKLDWMEFESDGMILNVRVEERIITDITKSDKICDVVASKAGIVNDILVYNGEATIMINDYVREKDTLIKGIIKYNEEDKRYTCADGKVFANLWYKVNVSIPFNYEEYERTGKIKYNIVWENNGSKKNILRKRFDSYDSNLTTILKVFDFKLYLDREEETRKITKIYTEDEALEVGINKAIENVNKKLGEFDKIIDKKVLKKVINNSTMDIEVFVVTSELISTQKEITIESNLEGIEE